LTPASTSWKRDYLALLEERARRRARTSLPDFARYLAPAEYQFSWHHDVLYRWLDDFAEGRRKRVIVQLPPGHGKSEGVSRNLPAYLLGRDPNTRVIACSYTADLAREMNRDVQRVMTGDRYQDVFPETCLARGGTDARRNADIFDVPGHRGYYKCAGVGGGITGRRFDKGIIDDPVKDREAANSPVQREAVWRWFTSAFSTRQARDASILITLTRWHQDDLAGRLIRRQEENDTADRWDVLSLPAIAGANSERSLRSREDLRQPGEALWPWFKPLPELEKQKALDPRDFAALYQQDPRAEGGTEWPDSWFGPDIWFDSWPEQLVVKVLALDPSKGKDARFGDYSAFVLAGLDADGRLWVDADLERRPTPQIVEDGLRLFRAFNPAAFVVEVNQYQELLGVEFARVAGERRLHLPLFGINNTANKEVRIRTLGPYLARGELRFKAKSPGARMLVEQLRQFPVGDHDDGPDSLEFAVRMILHLLGERNGPGQPTALRA
jgi:predicted phage terminase large subunit-like protein